MPEVVAAGKMAEAYTVKFPKGLPHTLMVLKQGGFGSPIIENGKIVGMASFTPMLAQAAVMGAFTVLSIATGQFFLAQINKELHKINKKLDEILAFLYGDKQAELLAELNFLQYACDNYAPIMECGDQRIATLVSMQAAKKVAKKDIEFYMNDLKKKANPDSDKPDEVRDFKKFSFLSSRMEEIGTLGERLHLSLQLYLVCSLMEIYYSQNFSRDYIEYTPLYNFLKEMPYEALWCIISLRTKNTRKK